MGTHGELEIEVVYFGRSEDCLGCSQHFIAPVVSEFRVVRCLNPPQSETPLSPGSLQVLATSDAPGAGALGGQKGRRYNVRILLGKRDDPLLTLYARQLLEQMK